MAKTVVKKGTSAVQKEVKRPLKIIHVLLLVAYGFITVVTPNMNTLDSNGPKFMTLAFLNIAAFAFLFSRKELRTHLPMYTGFFGNAIGAAYTLLMVVSLLSFFNAGNLTEAILHFTKVFTVFAATCMIYILVMQERRALKWLAVTMTGLLIYDSITVYSDIQAFIEGGINSIGAIKSVYSNKNILAAAVFVKIPFALWLLLSRKIGLQILGGITVTMAMLAVFFISARAFYLGLFALTAVFGAWCIIRYVQTREKTRLYTAGFFVGSLIITVLLFSFIERNYYPGNKHVRTSRTARTTAAVPAKPDGKTASYSSIAGRISSISDPTGGNRFGGWIRSWHVFRERPLLGVGIGNWKIATLKEENYEKGDYTYQYKAHNDFIETTAETGIFGGILFLSIFLLTAWKFVQLLLRSKSPEALYLFFLPAFGLFCYTFDAFFNFPQDRPEIQALFALFTGTAIALTSLGFSVKPDKKEEKDLGKILQLPVPQHVKRLTPGDEQARPALKGLPVPGIIAVVLFLLVLSASAWVLHMNYRSLKLQRIIKQEINRGKLTSPADMFVKGFPPIPNLNVVGEPIAAQKARYLINEKRFDEAISILKSDRSSPYDTRPEYFLAMAYFEKKMPDSAMYYSGKVHEMKPNHFKNISILTNTLMQQGKQKEAEAILDKYLEKNRKDKDACLFSSSFYDKSGSLEKAVSIIDSAVVWFPADTTLVKQRNYIHRRQIMSANKVTVDAALGAFRDKRYSEAIVHLNKLLTIYPTYTEAREYRAFSYFFLKEYAKSIEDLNRLVAGGAGRPNLYNLLGVNYYNLQKRDEACANFKIARDLGDKDGNTNYNSFCQQTK